MYKLDVRDWTLQRTAVKHFFVKFNIKPVSLVTLTQFHVRGKLRDSTHEAVISCEKTSATKIKRQENGVLQEKTPSVSERDAC